jgi:polyphosphate kinase 2 (PPK2 family)
MGFCNPDEYLEFMRQTPQLERMLVNSGIHLFKFWFSVSREEQLRRFISRRDDPLKHWKLSPSTSSRWTNGMTTPRPSRPCSSTPIPAMRPGWW